MAAMSAAVARRLAEAADGFRTGEDVWFAANEADLRSVHAEPSETDAVAWAASHDGYVAYGPFNTPPDPVGPAAIATIRLDYVDGSYMVLDGAEVDALFFTPSARDKFLYPYCARMLGPQKAADLKDEHEALTWDRDLTVPPVIPQHPPISDTVIRVPLEWHRAGA